MTASEIARKQLITDEGLRLKAYKDTKGITSLGVGRNLEDYGISYDEAMIMLDNDIKRCEKEAVKFKWWVYLDDARKAVILNMLFNLGLPRFMQFKKFHEALEANDYDLAALEMLESRWAKDVGDRALRLANVMKYTK